MNKYRTEVVIPEKNLLNSIEKLIDVALKNCYNQLGYNGLKIV